MKNLIVFLLMTAGTVGATLGVARTDPSVENWQTRLQANLPLTIASLLVLAVGVGLRHSPSPSLPLRGSARVGEPTADGQRPGTAAFASSLDRLAADVAEVVGAFDADAHEGPAVTLRLHELLEGPLKVSLESAVAGCLALRTSHGSVVYARVMGPLAKVERTLYRAWSAAADGYLEEAQSCLRQAREGIEKTRAALGEIG